MYIAPELEGVRAKLFRAQDHFRDLDVAVGAMLSPEQLGSAGHECRPEGEIIVTWPKQPPLDPRLALIAGDCIHTTRSALDHLVAQLAILNGAPPDALKKTTFPVCLLDTEFKSIAKRKVAPFISTSALAEIEKLQPYSTRHLEKDLLWVISQLDIIDKHRLLIIAKHKMRPTAFRVTTAEGHEFVGALPHDSPWKSSEDGAEIMRFRLSGQGIPQPLKVRVELDTATAIQIEQTGLICDGANLLTLLADSINYVGWIVDNFGHMFFGEPL